MTLELDTAPPDSGPKKHSQTEEWVIQDQNRRGASF